MTLAAENIALKAENARLRKALRFYDKAYCANCHNFISSTATEALAQPTPTTPETDKTQAVEAYRGGARWT